MDGRVLLARRRTTLNLPSYVSTLSTTSSLYEISRPSQNLLFHSKSHETTQYKRKQRERNLKDVVEELGDPLERVDEDSLILGVGKVRTRSRESVDGRRVVVEDVLVGERLLLEDLVERVHLKTSDANQRSAPRRRLRFPLRP